jgi:Tfp pilus assembly protein PilO
MLGKIPPFVLLIIGPLLVAAVVGGGYLYLYQPKQKEIAGLKQETAKQTTKAETKPAAEADLAKVKDEWVTAHEGLAQKMDERSIPISMAHPMTAMVTLWQEVREDLPPLVEKFVKESGCIIVRGHPGWTAPATPFPSSTVWIEAPLGEQPGTTGAVLQTSGQAVENWNPLAPRLEYTGTSPFAQRKVAEQRYIGAGAGVAARAVNANLPTSIQVAGKIENVERLYKSLRNFPRILTIQHLILTKLDGAYLGADANWIAERLKASPDELVLADLAMTVWILCEAPEAASAAGSMGAAGGGMGGSMGGEMPGGMGGGMPGAGGMPGMGGAGGAAPGGAGAGASKSGGDTGSKSKSSGED